MTNELKPVGIDEVVTFTETSHVTSSYLQTDRHTRVSERFKPIQPAAVGNTLGEQNFSLVSLITGKGRQADKLDFQRTISRYRSSDVFEIDGLHLDLIYISKHMGRGCDEMRLGLFRGVCANQWTAGTLFEIVKFRHSGDPLKDIRHSIDTVLSQRSKLVDTIRKMQSVTLTNSQVIDLAKEYANIRLEGKENVIEVDFKSLNSVNRPEDTGLDLWTVANVLQENVVNTPITYTINSIDKNGVPCIRNMHTRRLKDSSSQLVDLNSKLFDAALKLAA